MYSAAHQKILVVEDNIIVQQGLQIMAKKLGYEIDIAHDGATALAVYSLGYKLILMDINLPDISGLEVTRKIRQTEVGKSIYIVAITANSKARYLKQCLDAGMDGFSHKPTSVEQLEKIITKYIRSVHFH